MALAVKGKQSLRYLSMDWSVPAPMGMPTVQTQSYNALGSEHSEAKKLANCSNMYIYVFTHRAAERNPIPCSLIALSLNNNAPRSTSDLVMFV